jgi:predicted DNA-binding transcriptional regulator YafY
MATNKNAAIRYQALDRCFRNPGRKYYIEDLIDVCNEALSEIDPDSSGIQLRQIRDDIKFMRDPLGYNAPIEAIPDPRKCYYRYSDLSFSINNQPLNEKEAQQLSEALMTLSRFKGMPQFKWIDEIKARLEQSFNLKSEDQVLSFEQNPYLTGLEFIGELYNSIINKQTLSITYHPFKADEDMQFVLHPYYLKQYNNRWFLWGKNHESDDLANLALDRIQSVGNSSVEYLPNAEVNFEEFFEDVIGVTVPGDAKLETVVLKIDKDLWPYIKTKPIHGSQKLKEITKDYTIIELDLFLNFELEKLILSHGEQVTVLFPEQLRNSIYSRIIRGKGKYEDQDIL